MSCCAKGCLIKALQVAFGSLYAAPLAAAALLDELALAWTVAELRSSQTVAWLDATAANATPTMVYPTVGDLADGHWAVAANTRDWRAGFWPGTLWLLAQRSGSDAWRQHAADWSAPLAQSTNADHDIGFITLASLGKGWLYHDDLTDPGGAWRAFAKDAITRAATQLDGRFNQANAQGTPVPAGFTRSWNSPFEDPYPVCVDNLMNLEVMFLAYELNGRLAGNRQWFDHALAHARTAVARHLRADGSTYHVVKHFESGARIGQIERKSTLQGYGDESTWSRGQAWAIYGLTSVYRHARDDSASDASDILAAAQAAAGYFLDHLPHFTTDPYNHRVGDFVPPCDFDAALGEPAGPWNDANNNYNSATGSGLGDRNPAMRGFTARDTAAAAIAAAGLIELSGYAPGAADRQRYLAAAEAILHCLITYDGPDADTAPDYFCAAGESAHPGILKEGSARWSDSNRSLIYGDYYFLEALARYETLQARKLLAGTRQLRRSGAQVEFAFEMRNPAPALAFRVLRSIDLAEGSWTTLAVKTGGGAWSGPATVTEQALPNGHTLVSVADQTQGARGFFRVLTRSVGGGN